MINDAQINIILNPATRCAVEHRAADCAAIATIQIVPLGAYL